MANIIKEPTCPHAVFLLFLPVTSCADQTLAEYGQHGLIARLPLFVKPLADHD